MQLLQEHLHHKSGTMVINGINGIITAKYGNWKSTIGILNVDGARQKWKEHLMN